ncbi:MAG: hypothetical protein FWE13_03760 [Firmicutes bacterium]|nr:hypothetical protein [Bacillota bacterium]
MTKTTKISNADITNEIIFEIGKFAILWNVFEDKCRDEHIFKVWDKEEYKDIIPNDIPENELIFNINMNAICNRKKYFAMKASQPFKEFAIELKSRADFLGLNVEDYVKKNLYPEKYAIVTEHEKSTILPQVIEFINNGGTVAAKHYVAILAIFRIRNNMFHGLKWIHRLNNQVRLFETMNAVLEEIA